MKKFVIRGFCFVGIGLMLLVILNFFYVRTNGYKSLDGLYKLNMVPDNIDVMNLGSSHGEVGLNYDEIDGITGFNFGLRGQSLYIDLQLLKKYGDKLSGGCVVIIPISYFTFLQPRDHSNQHIQYYDYLDYGSIPNHNPIEYMRFRLLPVLTASFNIKYLIVDKKGIEPSHFIAEGEGEEHYQITAREHLWLFLVFAEANRKSPNNEENTEILGKIVAFCQEKGFKPVMITTPFTSYYNDYFSPEVYSDFYTEIERVSKKYDLPYLDYSHDPRFIKKLEWFADSDHLNTIGARMFTEILLTDLGLI